MLTARKAFAGLAVAVVSMSASITNANPNWSIGINIGPPPIRIEATPPYRAGYIWVPGYWEWRYNRHHWVRGHYLRDRHHHHYVHPRWDRRGNRWHYSPGRWDSDRDGVSDRYDREPYNPYRR